MQYSNILYTGVWHCAIIMSCPAGIVGHSQIIIKLLQKIRGIIQSFAASSSFRGKTGKVQSLIKLMHMGLVYGLLELIRQLLVH